MASQSIKIIGARQHNLKNLSLEIPRDQLVVITGMSGSGKSSLAFDTLYAEGQRRYVESLSAYARQFLDQMQKPDVDFIEGLSPAIALEQRNLGTNPRSTISTTTEIYDYLRVLYSAIGHPHDPETGTPIVRQTPQQIVDRILAWPAETRIQILAPIVEEQAGEFRDVLEKVKREGFVRVRIDGAIHELGGHEPIRLAKGQSHTIEIVVDRLVIREGMRTRLADSIETALKWGKSKLVVIRQAPDAADAPWEPVRFSTDYSNPDTGFTLPPLTPKHFSFNSHLGACPVCHGIGTEMVVDAELVVDPAKSLAKGAITPWQKAPKRMQALYSAQLEGLAKAYNFSVDTVYADLPEKVRHAVCFGTDDREIEVALGKNGQSSTASRPFEGVVNQLSRLYETTESETTRTRVKSFMSPRCCAACGGARLKPEILAVTLRSNSGQEVNIHEFCRLSIRDARSFIEDVRLSEQEVKISSEVLHEVKSRLGFLEEVGLGYLSLNRESGTLSGGESQRIRLGTQIGSRLAGVLYVLDEPSIGLHQRDNERLISTLRKLRDLGNTVIVVEHDEDTIRAADHIIDLGPGAGPRGGNLVAQGTVEQILATEVSLTAQYLSGRLKIPIPKVRTRPRARPPRLKNGTFKVLNEEGWLTVENASENNLAKIDASFPLGCFTAVTGVSGSGKSTLVDDILRRALFRHFYKSKDRPGKHGAIRGLNEVDKAIVIDQSPIGKTPRSNPVTYTGAFGPIRELFAGLPSARVRGYDAGRFSFNVKGGRCENCQGDGMIKIEMHFLADVYVECDVCLGKRYNRETLEITYKGKNIADILDMSVDEGSRFFRHLPSIYDRLVTLEDVGLGYLRLGQPATTLSGGEAQRVKLAAELARKATGRTVYILDEPTTGLHFSDIHKLLEVLMKLRDAGNTLIVIEHNLEMIKCADWVLDMGPEGGAGGGRIVAQGTPEEVAVNEESVTGQYLRRLLE